MKAIYIPKHQLDETLAQPPKEGKRNLDPFHTFSKENALPISLLEDHKLLENEAEVHMLEGDLWYCVEGEVEFVCDGKLIDSRIKKNKDGSKNPNELRGSGIKDGTTHTLHPGDWLFIPPEVPHMHHATGTARLTIIKIPKK